MAKNTNIDLRNQVIYSIYVRNHSEEGTFKSVEKDLDRIKSLGVDIIWFMPIHPIGVKNKKGDLGCPYAIKDYREINPEYGTLDDFTNIVEEIHKRGMKCIIDVVYNHTSPDSWLVENHPEFFFRKANGAMGNKTGEWWDVVDLEYKNKELWNYQIETLKMWAGIVDGFRCDVASMIPIDFWNRARIEVADINPECIWLAESIDTGFLKYNRDNGIEAHSDCEVYQAFDMCYDYDVKKYYDAYLKNEIKLSTYIDALNHQDCLYPMNYVKLRFLENHDNTRAKVLIPDEKDLINWTAFMYFQKGAALIYSGQEFEDVNLPSLFDIDKVNWNTGYDISELLKSLYKIKQNPLFRNGNYKLTADDNSNIVVGYYVKANEKLVGIFGLKGILGETIVDLEDGQYTNLIDGEVITVKDGKVKFAGSPIIIAGSL
ncbi:MAG: alpha-amylase [Clostridiales bacterium]|jgi:glycosidase|nr:alpha-amylase [Clostridiales bacterium]